MPKFNRLQFLLVFPILLRWYISIHNEYVKYGAWLARNWQNKSFYETPKIIVRETGNRIIATIDLENRYLLSSLYSIYPKDKNEKLSLLYLLGILNSSLATFVAKIIALELTTGAFTKFRTNQLGRIPIYDIDFSISSDIHFYDSIVAFVNRMLSLHQQLASSNTPNEKTLLQRQIDATDHQIDTLVYELYGLTDDEIKLVEEM